MTDNHAARYRTGSVRPLDGRPGRSGIRGLLELCDGIVTRIDNREIIRADEFCRACVVALLPRWLAPASALAGASVVTQIVDGQDAPSASPSRP